MGVFSGVGYESMPTFKPRTNLRGQFFGKLIAQRYLGGGYWECQCTCGEVSKVLGANLRKGRTRSCGKGSCRFGNDLEGQVFGKLTVLSCIGHTSTKQIKWLCRCTCGKTREATTSALREGNVRTCRSPECKTGVPKGEASFHGLLKGYQWQATKRGLEWSLTSERFRELTSQPCHYCGKPPVQVKSPGRCNGPYPYNGVDLRDTTRGYVNGNVVPCCKECNYAKRNLSEVDFEAWLYRLLGKTLANMPSAQLVNLLHGLGYELVRAPSCCLQSGKGRT